MNCTLLLVATTVCGWGDPAPAVVAAPVAGCSSCATPCSTCGESWKPGFLDRLKAKFAKHSDCGCSTPAPVHVKSYSPCSSCGEPSLFERLKAKFAKSECGCAAPAPKIYHSAPCHQTTACGCGESWKPGFLDKLKAKFAHHSECGCATTTSCASPCATGCGSTYTAPVMATPATGTPVMGAPTTGAPAPLPPGTKPAPIPAPKDATPTTPDKLPSPPAKEISGASLRIDPTANPTAEKIPTPF